MLHPKQVKIYDIYGKYPSTPDEVAEATIAVISKEHPVIGFAWDIDYSRKVSNSHQAPIKGYSNWGGDKGPVRNYPGFSGRVWIRFAENHPGFVSHLFPQTLTYPGTGGAGAYSGLWTDISHACYKTDGRNRGHSYPEVHCFSWDYRWFISDFPELDAILGEEARKHELAEDQRLAWAKLRNEYAKREELKFNHKFVWEDPVVKAADEEFIKNFNEQQEKEPV